MNTGLSLFNAGRSRLGGGILDIPPPPPVWSNHKDHAMLLSCQKWQLALPPCINL